MKNKHICIVLLIVLLFTLTGCNNSKSDNNESINNTTVQKNNEPNTMTKTEIISKLSDINNDITDLWNEVFCEVKWYSDDGTSATGEVLDIDFVISNMDKYYNKVKTDKLFIDKLSSDYSDIINAYSKMFDKATIIYNNLKSETPKANEKLKYRDDIDLFRQYADYLWDTIVDLSLEDYND